MDPKVTQLIAALGNFKDWSNYLLVTTVAALGWVATKPILLAPTPLSWTIVCFGVSIVFAVFTLALIPIVGETLSADTKSIYDVEAEFKTIWYWGPTYKFKLKWVCWPQHVFFLAGILIFSVGSIAGVLNK